MSDNQQCDGMESSIQIKDSKACSFPSGSGFRPTDSSLFTCSGSIYILAYISVYVSTLISAPFFPIFNKYFLCEKHAALPAPF